MQSFGHEYIRSQFVVKGNIMFSYLGAFLGPVLSAAKAWILLFVVITVGGYIGYLNWGIATLRTENNKLQASVSECEDRTSELNMQRELQDKNIEKLQAYYRDKKCLDLRGGELKDEDFKLK